MDNLSAPGAAPAAEAIPLFRPLRVRGLVLRNRIVISPMCMYSAPHSVATDFHLAHYSRFALGGAGLVIIEATAVVPEGRITHGDLGLWSDDQIEPLARVIAACQAQGAAVGVQLVHSGRKAARQRPWHGNGPMGEADAARGELSWPIASASAIPFGDGYLMPEALTLEGIGAVRQAFTAAAKRAVSAGADLVEIHAAHGFLLHSFMSPATNTREDAYNGDFDARHRFVVEVSEDLRDAIPDEMPLFVRISMHDAAEPARPFAETVKLAGLLGRHGVDVIDCSSGGIGGHSASTSGGATTLGFQLPDTAQIRNGSGMKTMAVGLITEPELANAAIEDGQTDLVAIGREALWDPNWPHHARAALGGPRYTDWPEQYGWWLARREPLLAKIMASSDRRAAPAIRSPQR
ncbi:MAG: NADH:flavin oxidoreductase/NADH oxidase [Rhizobiaceae bacterium]|nr:NADH:flavin oxidoreductase/NADH oxidase [Rhizobiaceae bacterium]